MCLDISLKLNFLHLSIYGQMLFSNHYDNRIRIAIIVNTGPHKSHTNPYPVVVKIRCIRNFNGNQTAFMLVPPSIKLLSIWNVIKKNAQDPVYQHFVNSGQEYLGSCKVPFKNILCSFFILSAFLSLKLDCIAPAPTYPLGFRVGTRSGSS